MTAAENTFRPTGSESLAGERAIGKYRPIALLGEGGMARVYLAVMKGPGGFTKLLVIKSLRESLDDPVYLRSFMFEARLAAQLNHPNVVQTFEVGETEGRYFMAMEYLEGQCLRVIQRRLAPQRLPLAAQLRIFAEVACGLHYAHTLTSYDGTPLQIVHRDISPQNILITYDGQVKLLDFGIAKANGGNDLTKTGMIKGKVDYMAPEQIFGENVDHRADVFALGVMVWEAITGRRFSGGSEVADVTKIHNRVSGGEPKLRDVAPDTPKRLVEICERAIELKPEDRFATAEDFAIALTDYLRDTSQTPSARELADIVGPLFEKERKKIRKVVDEQVRLIDAGSSGEEMGVVETLPRVDSGDRSKMSAIRSGTTLGSDRVEPGSGSAPQAYRRRRLPPAVKSLGVAALGIFGAGVGAFAAMHGGNDEGGKAPVEAAVEPPMPEANAPAVEPAVPSAPTSIAVRIVTIPSEVEATLDGLTVRMPLARIVPRDEEPHSLEVRAEGYESVTRVVSFERDQDITIALRPIPSAAGPIARRRRRRGARGATSSSPAGVESSLSSGEATAPSSPARDPDTRRSIHVDTVNPYAE